MVNYSSCKWQLLACRRWCRLLDDQLDHRLFKHIHLLVLTIVDQEKNIRSQQKDLATSITNDNAVGWPSYRLFVCEFNGCIGSWLWYLLVYILDISYILYRIRSNWHAGRTWYDVKFKDDPKQHANRAIYPMNQHTWTSRSVCSNLGPTMAALLGRWLLDHVVDRFGAWFFCNSDWGTMVSAMLLVSLISTGTATG